MSAFRREGDQDLAVVMKVSHVVAVVDGVRDRLRRRRRFFRIANYFYILINHSNPQRILLDDLLSACTAVCLGTLT